MTAQKRRIVVGKTLHHENAVFGDQTFGGGLAPTASVTFSISDESSNYGGFGPLGVLFTINDDFEVSAAPGSLTFSRA